jgi:hypothetical protein
MTVDDSVERVENEADEEESAVGEESCVLQGLEGLADFFHCPVNTYNRIRQGTSTIQQERRVVGTTKVGWVLVSARLVLIAPRR